ncbi:MAG: UDP-N-acetylglucosamine diphosphorylase/glucosamine-1-phosphate N-acetyltransferase [Pseudomonadales bacterium]|nr:UDP-N-acetylglucosamine diphosphorylase/glucosamine-1-phosphate N-acetyltransferase [Pseudomonadales bacterium]
MRKLDVVVLAAGKGTRMNSNRPKVLHELAGRTLLNHVLDTTEQLTPAQTAVVIGFEAEQIQLATPDTGITWVAQTEQLGTGHAVQQALPQLHDDHVALVVCGDVPLVTVATLHHAVAAAEGGEVGLVTANMQDPAELGRIVRNSEGRVQEIVEFKDANAATRAISEINSGIMAIPAGKISGWLGRLKNNNAQSEFYLTDIIAMAVADGVGVSAIGADEDEVTGINDRVQLAQVERAYQRAQAEALMQMGATIADPQRIDIRGRVTCDRDCFIDINVVLAGNVTLGADVRIGAGAVITDAQIGDGSIVQPHTVVDGAVIAKNCSVGPFARIRPGSVLEDGVKVGNFVETKKAHLGPGTKAGHLTYLGDTSLGADCNVGAGTVTCNYDGVDKHRTEIGDEVFVGTNATLVAPVEIQNGAFVAAGSVVTSTVEAGDLAVGRGKQRNIKGWTRPDQRTQQKK